MKDITRSKAPKQTDICRLNLGVEWPAGLLMSSAGQGQKGEKGPTPGSRGTGHIPQSPQAPTVHSLHPPTCGKTPATETPSQLPRNGTAFLNFRRDAGSSPRDTPRYRPRVVGGASGRSPTQLGACAVVPGPRGGLGLALGGANSGRCCTFFSLQSSGFRPWGSRVGHSHAPLSDLPRRARVCPSS